MLNTGTTQTEADLKCKIKPDTFCSKTCLMTSFSIIQWLPSYTLSYLKRDILAGITVSILGVPQCLAYSNLAGLPPEWGLYTSIVPILMYVMFGTSTQICLGTVAATCIMIASAIETIMISKGYHEYDQGYEELYQSLVITLTFVCGIIRILLGLFRAGFIVVFLSRPVMTGFISSVAFIILINQFRELFGLNMDRYPLFYQTLYAIVTNITSINIYTTSVSSIALVILFLPKCVSKIPKWIPMPLIVIVIFSVCSYFIGANKLESMGIILIGNDIKSGLPTLKTPNFRLISDVWFGAFVIAIVSYMGSIALAKEFEQKKTDTYKRELNIYNKWYNDFHVSASQVPLINTPEPTETIPTGTDNESECRIQIVEDNDKIAGKSENKHPIKPLPLANIKLNPNMEFIAYGIADILGCFLSGMISSASFSRSALNYEMNVSTQMSSVVEVIIALFCLLFLMPLLSTLPKCVLAAVVTTSVYRLIKNGIKEFKFLCYVSKIELIEFMISFIGPLIFGLEYGILISVISSIIVNLLRRAFSTIIFLGQWQSKVTDQIEYVDLNAQIFKQEPTKLSYITIIEMAADLAFINNNRLVETLRQLLSDGNNYIVVSLKLTSFIDTTSIRQIASIFEDASDSHICLSQCSPKVTQLIHRYEKNEETFPENIRIFVSTHDAVQYLHSVYNSSKM